MGRRSRSGRKKDARPEEPDLLRRLAERSCEELTPEAREAGRNAPVWETGYYGLPAVFDSDLKLLPVAAPVVGGDRVLYVAGGASPGAEAEPVAAGLEEGLLAAARHVGGLPPLVQVRHPEVAVALGRRLASRGVEVRAVASTPGADLVALSLAHDLVPEIPFPPSSSPFSWLAWGYPPWRIGQLFQTAARFFRARPWDDLAPGPVSCLRFPSGDVWFALLRGALGSRPGLTLFSDEADLETLRRLPRSTLTPSLPQGQRVDLDFIAAGELPPPMRKEISRARWEVASAGAHPTLTLTNTPGGGLPAALLTLLEEVLGALARRPRTRARPDGRPADPWADPETGIRIEPFSLDRRGASDGPDAWNVPETLSPGGPQGRGADLAARVGRVTADGEWWEIEAATILPDFQEWLRAHELPADHVFGSLIFLRQVLGTSIPLASIHENDLRLMLLGWLTTSPAFDAVPAGMLASGVAAFLRYLEDTRGISCPWAGPILADVHFLEGIQSVADRDGSEPNLALSLTLLSASVMMKELGLEPALDLATGEILVGPGPEPGTEMAGPVEDLWGEDDDDTPPEPEPGALEQALQGELGDLWLVWREELIAQGVVQRLALLERLCALGEAWATQPHPRLGRTPRELVLEERRTGGG